MSIEIRSIKLTSLYVRFLVDVRWMKQWKKYVGYDESDQVLAGQQSANPGPLDNSNLFEGNRQYSNIFECTGRFKL